MAHKLTLFLVSAFLVAPLAQTQEPPPPAVEGYVTHVDASGFDVNGLHIVIGPRTAAGLKANSFVSVGDAHELAPYLGERATVFGKRNDKTHTIEADRIVLDPRKLEEVSGFGIIDALLTLPKDAQPGDQVVRADGYPVLISSKTKIHVENPAPPNAPATTNMWLGFQGHQRADGIVVADKITLSQNIIKPNENKMLAKSDYDPAEVDPDAGQDPFAKLLFGRDPKQIPPYENPAMQARVTSVGTRLVPQYQKDLPSSDLTRIVFRFQLVDQKGLDHTFSIPNGLILVPRAMVERIDSDDQLAAVLADAIAGALEKQAWRGRHADHVAMATEVGGVLVFGLAPTVAGALVTRSKIAQHREEQRDRVSLGLMHSAGFNLAEAPRVWWLLNGKKGKDLAQIKLPHRTGVLYEQLAITWRQTLSPTGH